MSLPQESQKLEPKPARRSKMEMLCDTLSVIASGESAPTRVMYHANMSWIETKRCLKTLIGRGLVEAKTDQKREYFNLTKKGMDLVRTFKSVRQDLHIDDPL